MKYFTAVFCLLVLFVSSSYARVHPPCEGVFQQGGLLLCRFPENTVVRLSDRTVKVDSSGLAVIGLRQSEPQNLKMVVFLPNTEKHKTFEFSVKPRDDDYREIEGLECDSIDARTDQQKAHAGESYKKKVKAFAQFEDTKGVLGGFELPAEGKHSSPFGPTRKYLGVSAVTGKTCEKISVHRGYDIAARIGTPVTAPAAGVIALADRNLYYEGGTVFIDHGHGLMSVLLHMSEVNVKPGQTVEKGQKIGAVGNTGRTTGPHLHWGVKWRNSSHPNSKADFYIDPALLLQLESMTSGK